MSRLQTLASSAAFIVAAAGTAVAADTEPQPEHLPVIPIHEKSEDCMRTALANASLTAGDLVYNLRPYNVVTEAAGAITSHSIAPFGKDQGQVRIVTIYEGPDSKPFGRHFIILRVAEDGTIAKTEEYGINGNDRAKWLEQSKNAAHKLANDYKACMQP